MAKQTRPQLTAEEAQTFGRYSVANATRIEAALECDCRAYVDVFTYRRWRALGYQVQRGERAIRIPVVTDTVREDEDGTSSQSKRFNSSSVFCRHQLIT